MSDLRATEVPAVTVGGRTSSHGTPIDLGGTPLMAIPLRRRWRPSLPLALGVVAALAAPAAAVEGAPPAREGEAVITTLPASPATRGDAATALADLAVAARGPLTGTALADVPADAPAAILHGIGVVHGHADGRFLPDAAVTRGQLASLGARLLAELRGHGATGAAVPFADVAGHPHAAGIAAASRDGLVHGRTDGSFGPDAATTPAQLGAVVSRLRGVLHAEALIVTDPMPDPVIATFDTPEGSFRVLLDQPAAIDRVAGAEPGTHVGIPNGRLLPGDGGVNTGHDWHLVEVEIVDVAMEVCDGTAAYLDRVGLDAWYASQGERYCPWGATYAGSIPAGAPSGS